MRHIGTYAPAAAVALAGGITQAGPWDERIDLIWDCQFAQPLGQSQIWLTINGQDGSAYRFGGATLGIGGDDYELDGTIWPERAEFHDTFGDYGPSHTLMLTITRSDGVAQFTPPAGGASVTGQCGIREQ